MSDEPKPPVPSHQPESRVDEASAPPVGPAPSAGQGERSGDGAEPKAERSAGRRGRMVAIVLAVVLGGLAVLCVGGLGVGYLFYRQVSEPDRKTPAVVVEQFVEATFNERDHSRARLFTCPNAQLGELDQLMSDLRARESQFNTRFTVQTANLNVHTKGGFAAVDAELQLSTSVSRSTQLWQFDMKNESGWRVCGAQQTG